MINDDEIFDKHKHIEVTMNSEDNISIPTWNDFASKISYKIVSSLCCMIIIVLKHANIGKNNIMDITNNTKCNHSMD